MKKYWPIVVSLIGVVAPFVSGAVQGFYSSHPQVVAVIAGVWATFKFLLPSPLQK